MKQLFINDIPTDLFVSSKATDQEVLNTITLMIVDEMSNPFKLNEAFSCHAFFTVSRTEITIEGDEDLKIIELKKPKILV